MSRRDHRLHYMDLNPQVKTKRKLMTSKWWLLAFFPIYYFRTPALLIIVITVCALVLWLNRNRSSSS